MKTKKNQKYVRNKNFYYGLTVVLSLVFVGVLAASTFYSYKSNRKIYEEELKNRATEHTLQLETLFGSYGRQVSFISKEEAVSTLLSPDSTQEEQEESVVKLEGMLQDSRASLPMFTGMAVQGVDGKIYMNTLKEKLTDEYAARLLPEKFEYSSEDYAVTFGTSDEYTGVMFSSQVHDENQQVIGYIHFFFNTKMYEIVNEAEGEGPYIFATKKWTYLYSKDVLTPEDRQNWLASEEGYVAAAQKAYEAKDDLFTYKDGEGETCLARMAISEQYDFCVVSAYRLSEVGHALRPLMYQELVVAVLLLFLLEVLIYELHKRTEKPVRDMIEQCARLSTEESNVKIEPATTDKHLRKLAEAFNTYSDKIQKIAYEDELLGIGNRKKCIHDLEMMIANPEVTRFNIYVIDIVGFGMYNDIFTMEVGNEILKMAKESLQTVFGDWLYRVDGDVFVGIDFSAAKKQSIVWTVLQALGKSIRVQNLEIELKAKIGICEYPTQAEDARAILERAQVALHSAKQRNKNFTVYDKSMVKNLRREEEIASLLKRRMKDQELEVWLQPIYYIDKKCFESCEALLRIRDDEGNFISPLEVIEVAEKKGLIDQVTDYVLNKVCQMVHRMKELNTDLEFIRINLSAHQLAQKNYAQVFLDTLEKNHVAPQSVGVEVTETLLIQSFDTAISTLQTLRAHGVRVALDDFGSGYSSINYLYKLPIDTVKLDRELTVQIVESMEQKMFVSTIFKLAKIKRMEVLVEGVETEDVVRAVIAGEADCIQGYYFSRPLPPDEFERFMVSKKKQ